MDSEAKKKLLEVIKIAHNRRDVTRINWWKYGEKPTVAEVRQCILEIIELADCDALDILQSRTVEQEVLDILDKPETR